MKINFLKDSNTHIFTTNSPFLKVFHKMKKYDLNYAPYSGVSTINGLFFMYKLYDQNQWFNLDIINRDSPYSIDMTYYTKGTNYDILIYKPMANPLKEFYIEIQDNCYFKEYTNSISEDILVCGGKQSFGIGVTTLGLMFSNILSRKLNTFVKNISSDKSNYLKETYNYLINNKVIQKIIILEVHSFEQEDSTINEYLFKILEIIKNKNKKIILWHSIPKYNKKYKKINNLLTEYSNNKNIFYIDMSFIHEGEYKSVCTYDSSLINDTGNILLYNNIIKLGVL